MKKNNKYFNQNLNMNINYIFMRLRLFLKSPIFPIITILGTILFLVFIIYSSPVMLCDDNVSNLYELKTQLTSELAKYRVSLVKIEQYTDLQQQLSQIPRPNYRNWDDLNEYYINKHNSAVNKKNQSLTILNSLEAAIKRIEPDFKTPVDSNYYGRVARGF
jgi:hypothetical protein